LRVATSAILAEIEAGNLVFQPEVERRRIVLDELMDSAFMKANFSLEGL